MNHIGTQYIETDRLILRRFERVGVRRITAGHDVNNPHSGDVMRKCGMTLEEVREKSGQNNRGVCDMARYAIEAGDR